MRLDLFAKLDLFAIAINVLACAVGAAAGGHIGMLILNAFCAGFSTASLVWRAY